MMSIELGIFIAVLASFGLGIYLGQRGKSDLKEQVSNLKAKVKAMDHELAKALDAIRNYRHSDEEYGKSTNRMAERIARQDKLLERIKETLERHRLKYDEIYGWLKPVDGDEYTYNIEVVRKSNEDLERMHRVQRLAQPQKEPARAAPARATQHSSPAIPRQYHNEHYPRQDSGNDTVSMVTQAAVMCSVMDTTHERQPTPEPERCYSPSPDSYDTGSCNVSMD